MLPPLEGSCILLGKEILMSTINEEKKVAAQDPALNKMECGSNTFEGRIVSVIDSKLTMKNKEGKEYSHILATDATLTCDGTVCKAENLKAGSRIRVTTTKADRNVAIGVESLDKNAEFEECCS